MRTSHKRAIVSNLATMLGLAACTCGEEGDIPTIEAHIKTASRRR